jgi:ZIP family zinc transporter
MNDSLANVLFYTLFPVLAVVAGGVFAAFRPPGARLRSTVQHFAAGIVFAAVGLELLPDIMHERSPVAAVIGFVIGIGLMLGVKALTERFGGELSELPNGEATPESEANAVSLASEPAKLPVAAQPTVQNRQPTSLLITLGIDVLIDGLLIGVGFAAGAKQGVLITVALTIELLFLGLSAAVALAQAGATRARIVGVTAGLGFLLAFGAVVGTSLLGNLSGMPKEIVLSFGAAALLYLVTEELLVEAHEEPETPLLTAMFFVGFVVLLVIEMFAG